MLALLLLVQNFTSRRNDTRNNFYTVVGILYRRMVYIAIGINFRQFHIILC